MATSTAARRSTASKSPTKRPAATSKFNPEDLPATGSKQFRQNGDYKPSIKALAAFAKGNPVAVGHVKALIHLGWVKPGGVNAASKSPAFTTADNAGLPDTCFTVGEPAAPQISANLVALAELGAPADVLDSLWAAYVGV